MAKATRHAIEVQGDFLSKQAKSSTVEALSELIWNSLDADASEVVVLQERDELAPGRFIISDNGTGIPHSQAADLFKSLGGSWKKLASTTPEGKRFLHGSEGKGRFKALALGRVVDWVVTYKNSSGKMLQYTITMRAGDTAIEITDPVQTEQLQSGVKCIVSELHKEFTFLASPPSRQALIETFALYLKTYPSVRIHIPGQVLDPSAAIVDSQTRSMDPVVADGKIHKMDVEIVEWENPTDRTIYLCNEKGYPLSRLDIRIQVPGFNFSAYLKSSYISVLSHEGTLGLGELAPGLKPIIDKVKDIIKAVYREKTSKKNKNKVEQWKSDSIYPYKEEPKSEIEKIEREVFDIVAVQVSELLPDFTETPTVSQQFQLRMLRQAIEKSPEELELILGEVLNLGEGKRKEFAQLLKETSLSSIISASKVITDRLKTLAGLERLLFDPELKKNLKERTQLHRLLADNTWIFGEEFHLAVDDQSLTEVLRKHLEKINPEAVVDQQVTRVNGKKGIVDLMLTKTAPSHRADEHDHLIVELKRPTVKIGSKEISQIKEYAAAVAEDPRFASLTTRWTFWVISDELDSYAKRDANQAGAPKGRISISEEPRMTIWAKSWSEILGENKARLSFFQKQLNYQADHDDSVAFLREKYKSILDAAEVLDDDQDGQDEQGE